jgi:3-phosphoshikimate 1-carboxyvinyltransferase
VKECDRIAAMRSELAKIGVRVEADVAGDADAVTVTPPVGGVDCSENVPPVRFDTFEDHRMAMAFALIGLRRPNTWIEDPGCVAKTYPGFWRHLATFLAGTAG